MGGFVFFVVDGVEYCDEELALSRLLEAEELFCYSPDDKTTSLSVVCNDVFAWAHADAERFTKADIPDIYRAWIDDSMWGTAKWCCKKRKQKPQPPVEQAMRERGVWDEEMEALPENAMDAETQAIFATAAAQEK